jgi:hypothetical protein
MRFKQLRAFTLVALALTASPAFSKDYTFVIVEPGIRPSTIAAPSGNCTPATVAFSYTGSDQTFTVPAGCSAMTVTEWGAGGAPSTVGAGSGAGAYARGTFSISGGQQYTIVVGNAGAASGNAYGSGGAAAAYNTQYGAGEGGGGGGSFLRFNGADLLVAGGGGGAGWWWQTGYGLGGMAGSAGQAVGGTGATTGVDKGGDGGGGGGGGGHYGGAAGSPYGQSSSGSYLLVVPGGMGGQSYIDASATNGSSVAGSGATAPMQTDPNYVSGIGAGTTSNTAGNGRVVISYQ